MNAKTRNKRKQLKYNLPIIAHFANKSVRFDSIIQASDMLKAHYHLIFEAVIGKISKAGGAHWEFENGIHWLKYKSHYIRHKQNYNRLIGFNG